MLASALELRVLFPVPLTQKRGNESIGLDRLQHVNFHTLRILPCVDSPSANVPTFNCNKFLTDMPTVCVRALPGFTIWPSFCFHVLQNRGLNFITQFSGINLAPNQICELNIVGVNSVPEAVTSDVATAASSSASATPSTTQNTTDSTNASTAGEAASTSDTVTHSSSETVVASTSAPTSQPATMDVDEATPSTSSLPDGER